MKEYTLFFHSKGAKKHFFNAYMFNDMRELNSTNTASFIETSDTAEHILKCASDCVYKVESGNKLYFQPQLI